MNDDDEHWYSNITLPHILMILLGLWLLFGGFRCAVQINSRSASPVDSLPDNR